MAMNFALDDRLLAEVKRLGGQTTKCATVNDALQKYVTYRKQKKVLEIFGTLEWNSPYAYKTARRRK